LPPYAAHHSREGMRISRQDDGAASARRSNRQVWGTRARRAFRTPILEADLCLFTVSSRSISSLLVCRRNFSDGESSFLAGTGTSSGEVGSSPCDVLAIGIARSVDEELKAAHCLNCPWRWRLGGAAAAVLVAVGLRSERARTAVLPADAGQCRASSVRQS